MEAVLVTPTEKEAEKTSRLFALGLRVAVETKKGTRVETAVEMELGRARIAGHLLQPSWLHLSGGMISIRA